MIGETISSIAKCIKVNQRFSACSAFNKTPGTLNSKQKIKRLMHTHCNKTKHICDCKQHILSNRDIFSILQFSKNINKFPKGKIALAGKLSMCLRAYLQCAGTDCCFR